MEVRCNGTSLWIDEEPATVHIRGSLEERSEVEEHKEVTKHSPPFTTRENKMESLKSFLQPLRVVSINPSSP
ncbi:hypothetical protein [Peribacillus simplex]|uniref:hypothetical protein n=1 Tax=Peribacillus simplex TaxID=1478 RepID=UPI00398B6527